MARRYTFARQTQAHSSSHDSWKFFVGSVKWREFDVLLMVAVVDGCMIQLREGDEVLSELWKPISKLKLMANGSGSGIVSNLACCDASVNSTRSGNYSRCCHFLAPSTLL